MDIASNVWTRILSLLEKHLDPTTIKTWFDEAVPLSLEGNTFVLAISDPFKRTVAPRYIPQMQKAFQELFSEEFEILIVDDTYTKKSEPGSLPDFLKGGEDYTFDRFVVGPSNKFAHAAAMAVAEAPGTDGYNPLFIWGDSGLGKTHLLYAIAHEVHRQHPEYRIEYIKGDSFTNELIDAIRDRTQAEFHNKYRNCDLFLMDDVQFIAGRESTQEEMFHTFNTLKDAKKQIVFTADRPPKEMHKLEDRLVSRFNGSCMAKVEPPDYETRMGIIKNKSIRMGFELPAPVLSYMAENITANVRQLEGAVKKIVAFHSLMGEEVDVDTVIRAVGDIVRDKSDILPTAEIIIEEVAKYYSLDEEALRGQSRSGNILQARQVAIHLIREMTKLSLNEIGQKLGNRDHSTINNSIRKIETALKEDTELREIIKDITYNINAHYG